MCAGGVKASRSKQRSYRCSDGSPDRRNRHIQQANLAAVCPAELQPPTPTWICCRRRSGESGSVICV